MNKKFWTTSLAVALPYALVTMIYDFVVKDGLTLMMIGSAVIGGVIFGFLFA